MLRRAAGEAEHGRGKAECGTTSGGLLGPVGRIDTWRISRWDPGQLRDDVQEYVAERLGAQVAPGSWMTPGAIRKGVVSAGLQRQYSGTAGQTENFTNAVPAPTWLSSDLQPPSAATNGSSVPELTRGPNLR